MLENDLARARRALDDDPKRASLWIELGRLVARGRLSASMAWTPAQREALLSHLAENPARPELVRALLFIQGVQIAVTPADAVGEYWAAAGRARDDDGTLVEDQTGVALTCRRLQDGAVMRLVPTGRFPRGCSRGPADCRHEADVHVDAFLIDRSPVTAEQYDRFLAATGHVPPEGWSGQLTGPGRPAVQVTWADAVEYSRWVGGRLPTEAEWEKAARGESGQIYPWAAGTIDQHGLHSPDPARANFEPDGDDRDEEDVDRWLEEVGARPEGASPYGVLGLLGNVHEWCGDWYAKGYYPKAPDRNPGGPRKGKKRVIRGGSWWSTPAEISGFKRRAQDPERAEQTVGFRVVIPLSLGDASGPEPVAAARMPSAASQATDNVAAALESMMEARGFQRRGHRFWRSPSDQVCQVVEVKRGTAYVPHLRLACGIWLRSVAEIADQKKALRRLFGSPLGDCQITWWEADDPQTNYRFEDVGPPRNDGAPPLVRLIDETNYIFDGIGPPRMDEAATLVRLREGVELDVLPVFDATRSAEQLVGRWFEHGVGRPWGYEAGYVVTILLAAGGDTTRAGQVLRATIRRSDAMNPDGRRDQLRAWAEGFLVSKS